MEENKRKKKPSSNYDSNTYLQQNLSSLMKKKSPMPSRAVD